MKTSDFPMAIYRRGSLPGQIDHPGWLSKVVPDQAALDVALTEGWQIEMRDAPAPVADDLGDSGVVAFAAKPRRGWARKE